ncbi:prepilin peptidase [Coxiella-like endosymbiont]|uniref:prepilin peptidase n=1 Tax=Coxiella-like endosymbiont TaxID=1592897 RepID=UPI00272CF01D|nr:prepilin peptidase [Coxiella-like endosymbiont]
MRHFLLRGLCVNCYKKIPTHYFLVELLSAILSVLIVIRYQITWNSLAALLFIWLLIVLFYRSSQAILTG